MWECRPGHAGGAGISDTLYQEQRGDISFNGVEHSIDGLWACTGLSHGCGPGSIQSWHRSRTHRHSSIFSGRAIPFLVLPLSVSLAAPRHSASRPHCTLGRVGWELCPLGKKERGASTDPEPHEGMRLAGVTMHLSANAHRIGWQEGCTLPCTSQEAPRSSRVRHT